MGIDQVAHRLLEEPVTVENPNPSIQIFEGEFPHGGVRLVHYYFDEKGDVVSKSRATECRAYEMDKQGKILWSEIQKL